MTNKILNILLFVFAFSFSINAQIAPLFSPVSTNHENDTVFTEAGTVFYYYMGSNSINNQFASAVFKSEFLDEHIKNSNYLKGKNIFGNDLYSNTYIAVMPDSLWGSSQLGYRIGFGTRQFRSLRFTDDLFNVVFFGNKDYAGKEAIFNNTKLRLLDFQEIQFGLFKDFNDDNLRVRLYFGLNLLKGQQFQMLNLYKGSLYTAETGEYLDLKTRLYYYTSDQSHKNFTDINGYGLSCNAYLKLENTKSHFTFTFASQDLGYIVWNKKSYKTAIDTSMHFEGIEISNVLSLGQSNIHGLSKDSLMNTLYAHNDTTRLQISLPERLTMEIQKEWSGFFRTSLFGISYIFDSGQTIPQFYVMQTAGFTKWLNGGIIANYGGFSGFNAGIMLQFHTGKHFSATLASADITGFILPSDPFARSISTSICYKF
jgi:hypothetical protein